MLLGSSSGWCLGRAYLVDPGPGCSTGAEPVRTMAFSRPAYRSALGRRFRRRQKRCLARDVTKHRRDSEVQRRACAYSWGERDRQGNCCSAFSPARPSSNEAEFNRSRLFHYRSGTIRQRVLWTRARPGTGCHRKGLLPIARQSRSSRRSRRRRSERRTSCAWVRLCGRARLSA
jgi:hypothetical protein